MEIDCTNADTAMESICRVLGTTSSKIKSELSSITIDELFHHLRNDKPFSPKSILQRVCDSKYKKKVTSGIWFHATRLERNEKLSEGLLPTSKVKGILKSKLLTIAREIGIAENLDWDSIDCSGYGARRLGEKMSSYPFDDGPHGFLVKDTILDHSILSIADYTRCPEYIYELCSKIPNEIGQALRDSFIKKTYPAIVTFRTERVLENMMITTIWYLHSHINSLPLNDLCCIGLDCKGNTIENKDVISIEYILDE